MLDRWRGCALKALVSNAAPLPQRTKETIVDYFGDGMLHEIYGSTEGGIVTNLRPPDQLRKQQCVGRPFLMNQVSLLGEEGKPVSCRRSRRALQQFALPVPRLLESTRGDGGDDARRMVLGRRPRVQDEEGYLYSLTARRTCTYPVASTCIPARSKSSVPSSRACKEAAVVGVQDDYWGEAGRAFVVLQPGATLGAGELITACKQDLAGYKVPRQVVFLDALPRNAAGKVLKTDLRKRS